MRRQLLARHQTSTVGLSYDMGHDKRRCWLAANCTRYGRPNGERRWVAVSWGLPRLNSISGRLRCQTNERTRSLGVARNWLLQLPDANRLFYDYCLDRTNRKRLITWWITVNSDVHISDWQHWYDRSTYYDCVQVTVCLSTVQWCDLRNVIVLYCGSIVNTAIHRRVWLFPTPRKARQLWEKAKF